MDDNERDEILNNEFSDELQLLAIVELIEGVYRKIEYHAYWSEIEDSLIYLKHVLKEKTKEHDNYHGSYGNWRNKLAVVHCQNPLQKTFVTSIWDLILHVKRAYLPDDTSADADMRIILNEVLDTVEDCGLGARSYPLGHLVEKLEILCWDIGGNPDMVQATLISSNVSFRKLYTVYRKLNFFDDELDDDMNGLPSHFLKAFASLIQSFIRKFNDLDDCDREKIHQQCKEDVKKILDELHANEEDYTPRLIERYERLENDL